MNSAPLCQKLILLARKNIKKRLLSMHRRTASSSQRTSKHNRRQRWLELLKNDARKSLMKRRIAPSPQRWSKMLLQLQLKTSRLRAWVVCLSLESFRKRKRQRSCLDKLRSLVWITSLQSMPNSATLRTQSLVISFQSVKLIMNDLTTLYLSLSSC